ncbi:MAG: DUF493 family protein [Flavobacteriaceae bacterium]|nr:DUF493 family protein [Bacteroidia bacterium]MBT8287899.1 DUF493 family protein [Bacteroidia bacterium]NNF74517.1 DUF493 family protein [Flavobacteriaceae bacterium]NNK73269.1 DUF493 family protein [Flavobacteriaceae bacterium]
MNDKKKEEEFYNKLRIQLQDSTNWPSQYLYKFIVKSDRDKIDTIETIFNHSGAVIKTTESKNGTYTSVSINVVMKDPDAVISKYIEVSEKVEGVISL